MPEYKAYLEQRFVEGMTWENYGTIWSIDRVIPFVKWDLTNPEEAALCITIAIQLLYLPRRE